MITFKLKVFNWNPNGTNDIEILELDTHTDVCTVVDSMQEALFGLDVNKFDLVVDQESEEEYAFVNINDALNYIAVSPVSMGSDAIGFLAEYFDFKLPLELIRGFDGISEDAIEMIKQHEFDTVMSGGHMDGWNNYSGSDYSNWVCGVSTNRDAEALTRANYKAACNMIPEKDGMVEYRSCSHWACGWFEQIMVRIHPSNVEALNCLAEILKGLEDYPVIDDQAFSDEEFEEYSEYAEQFKSDLVQALITHFGIPEEYENDTDLEYLAYQLNMESQYYSGGGVIDLYDFREPEEYALDRLESVLHQISYDFKENPFFEYLTAVLDVVV